MREPDFVHADREAGEDRLVLDAHFGGDIAPFRAVIYSDYELIEGAVLPPVGHHWKKADIALILQDWLKQPGKVKLANSAQFVEALRMVVKDKSSV